MVGRYDAEVGAVLGLLEPEELFHALRLVKHAATGVAHGQHIFIRSVVRDVSLHAEHLADIVEQRLVECPFFRQPTDGDDVQGLARQLLLQTLPNPLRLLAVGHHPMRFVSKQRQLLAISQQRHVRLLAEEAVEHGCQQAVEGIVKGVYRHPFNPFNPWSFLRP